MCPKLSKYGAEMVNIDVTTAGAKTYKWGMNPLFWRRNWYVQILIYIYRESSCPSKLFENRVSIANSSMGVYAGLCRHDAGVGSTVRCYWWTAGTRAFRHWTLTMAAGAEAVGTYDVNANIMRSTLRLPVRRWPTIQFSFSEDRGRGERPPDTQKPWSSKPG